MAKNHIAILASVSMNMDMTSATHATIDTKRESWSLPFRPTMNLANFSRI